MAGRVGAPLVPAVLSVPPVPLPPVPLPLPPPPGVVVGGVGGGSGGVAATHTPGPVSVPMGVNAGMSNPSMTVGESAGSMGASFSSVQPVYQSETHV